MIETHYSVPGGCKYCGIEKQNHCTQWVRSVGLHVFTPPEDELIKARMQLRKEYSWRRNLEAQVKNLRKDVDDLTDEKKMLAKQLSYIAGRNPAV